MAAFRGTRLVRGRRQSSVRSVTKNPLEKYQDLIQGNLSSIVSVPRAVGKNVYSYILANEQSELAKQVCQKITNNDNKIGTGKSSKVYWSKILLEEQEFTLALKVLNVWDHHRFTTSDPFNTNKLKKSIEQGLIAAQGCLTEITPADSYIGLDSFANEIVIASLLHKEAKDSSFPQLYQPVIAGVECGSKKVVVSSLAQGDLLMLGTRGIFSSGDRRTEKYRHLAPGPKKGSTTITVLPDITLGIIQQVTAMIKFLQEKLSFVHGDLKIKNILYYDQPFISSAGNFSINCPVTVAISDLGNSSVSVKYSEGPGVPEKTVRIFNEIKGSKFWTKYTNSYSFKSKERPFCVHTGESNIECGEANWWILPSQLDQRLILWTAHSGLPFYKSYDLYVFLVSMLMVPQYYYSIVNLTEGKELWEILWLSSESSKIEKRILKSHGKDVTMGNIFAILKGISIRCDLIELLEKYFSNVPKY